jgi:hypothetical protein
LGLCSVARFPSLGEKTELRAGIKCHDIGYTEKFHDLVYKHNEQDGGKSYARSPEGDGSSSCCAHDPILRHPKDDVPEPRPDSL